MKSKSLVSAMTSGLLFGVGLALSGMIYPEKVLGFLDVSGDWDPSLAFVMGGALVVSAPLLWFARRKGQTLAGQPLQFPTSVKVDGRLLTGAALFGLGWGLVGLCPGPALAGLAVAPSEVALFVGAMVGGSLLHNVLRRSA